MTTANATTSAAIIIFCLLSCLGLSLVRHFVKQIMLTPVLGILWAFLQTLAMAFSIPHTSCGNQRVLGNYSTPGLLLAGQRLLARGRIKRQAGEKGGCENE